MACKITIAGEITLNTADVLPCPFCGAEAAGAVSRLSTGQIEWARCVCSKCAALSPKPAVEDAASAIASWNARHHVDATAPLVEYLAQIAYRTCAETNHVSLGQKVADAIRSAARNRD